MKIRFALLAALVAMSLQAEKVKFENDHHFKITELVIVPAANPGQKIEVTINPRHWKEVNIPGRTIKTLTFKEYWTQRAYEKKRLPEVREWKQENAKENAIMNKPGVNAFRIGRYWK